MKGKEEVKIDSLIRKLPRKQRPILCHSGCEAKVTGIALRIYDGVGRRSSIGLTISICTLTGSDFCLLLLPLFLPVFSLKAANVEMFTCYVREVVNKEEVDYCAN
jgi:hypothetical protein